MIPRSVLDLAPVTQGSDAAQALKNSLDLARHAEKWGYRRVWFAEHHNMTGVASAATAVVIAHIAAGTSTIRVGAGGIMLPNHAPLVIAEQFGTLASLHPGRIDLGLGRAPGTDPLTTRALRRTLESGADSFAPDVRELQALFAVPEPGQRIRAVPGAGLNVPLWILGSSLYGAQLAASMGLPFAFASHFAPTHMTEAVALYRSRFRPSSQLSAPYVMLGLNVVAAETDQQARLLLTSLQQAFANLQRGQPGPLPPPVPMYEEELSPPERELLARVLSCSVVGSPETVARGVRAFEVKTGADEIIMTSMIYDHAARLRSFEIAAPEHSTQYRSP